MINVIGLGYIGLPTALMFATHGNEVVGTDYNQDKIKEFNNGEPDFNEVGLVSLFRDAVNCGIKFSTEYHQADYYIISVQTPYISDTKKIDTSYVIEAVKSVLEVCKKDAVVIIESTVSPGTIDNIIRPLVNESNKQIHLVHAPERIIPGNMIYELIYNNRTVGADSDEIAQRVKGLYRSFCKAEITTTDIRTAEMTKVIENTFRAVNIAFANELSKICREQNMDVFETIRICNKHPRVNILNPGPGVGGHCISVDPWFLVGDYPNLTNIIGASMEVNDTMPDFVVSRIKNIMSENGIKDNSRVGLYGLSYKENVDDYRESPTLQLLSRSQTRGMKSYDPYIEDDITANQMHNLDKFLDSVDMVVVMVKHDEIKSEMKKLQDKVVLDCHHIIYLPNVYRL